MADHWDNLLIERRVSAEVATDSEFRNWMRDRGIFVSSAMDTEMRPFRERLRDGIRSWGGRAEMWEERTPRDAAPERAYLEGVDRSAVYVLLLGGRYGVADGSGYSATHKECNRAKERNIPRLLFIRAGVAPSERDGRLNDWLGSLYAELSGNTFADAEDLWRLTESRLREMAGEEQQLWVKLGRIVFPGSVEQRRSRDGATAIVTARVTTAAVRTALLHLSMDRSAERLTWSHYSVQVQVQEVSSSSARAGEDVIQLTCRITADGIAEWPMAVAGSAAGVGRKDLMSMWARWAFLGEPYEPKGQLDIVFVFTRPESPSLPDVLEKYDAAGWLASGLCRLYMVEEVSRRYGGEFRALELGVPAGRSIAINVRFSSMNWGQEEEVGVEGAIPLPR
jgi:hypothetical protein